MLSTKLYFRKGLRVIMSITSVQEVGLQITSLVGTCFALLPRRIEVRITGRLTKSETGRDSLWINDRNRYTPCGEAELGDAGKNV